MGLWLEFVQLALALGLGWLVWALLRVVPASRGYKGKHGKV